MPRRRSETLGLTAALALLAAAAAWADEMYLKVRAVGDHIECTCGCSSTISTCNMVGCHVRVPINEQIEAGLEAGQSQEEILAAVYEKYGEEMRVEPRREGFGIVGWVMPFVSLLAGLAVIPFVVRRWRRNARAHTASAPVSDRVVDRYRGEIERQLEEME